MENNQNDNVEMLQRFVKIRKTLKLTQTEFATKLGLKTASISKIESGQRAITTQTIKLLSSELHVNILWLTSGQGEMFLEKEEFLLNQLSTKYELDESDIRFIKNYINTPKAERKILLSLFI